MESYLLLFWDFIEFLNFIFRKNITLITLLRGAFGVGLVRVWLGVEHWLFLVISDETPLEGLITFLFSG